MGRPPKKKPRLDHEAIDLLPVPLQQREFAHRIIVVLYAAAAPVPREVLAALAPDHCNFDELLAAAKETLRALPLEIAKVAGLYDADPTAVRFHYPRVGGGRQQHRPIFDQSAVGSCGRYRLWPADHP
jgi:hypothetical protein